MFGLNMRMSSFDCNVKVTMGVTKVVNMRFANDVTF